ncbi:uncharacterized protein F54H12.2 [Trichonephila clavipes]|nr:uncharacterized protein F54H12.2 [Trichonephila clavipes]
MLDIISAVQLALPQNPNRFTINYNKATKRVKINAVQGNSLHLENVGQLLGFKRNAIIIGYMKSEFVADAWSNFSVFCVYSDLISPQIVGDIQAPLLRIVRTKGQDEETISQYYDRPQYLPLVRHSFQTIQSELRLNSGDFVPFERGQISSGLTHYKGINFQKGYGIGGIFRRLFRAALPFLVKGVDLKIKFIRRKPEFCLQGSEGFKVVLDHVSLFLRKVRVNPGVILGHAKALEKTSAKYPINRVLCKVYSIPKGSMSFIQDNIFSGQMPKKLFIGCVDNEAFHGSFSKSPYEFKHFNLNFIGVYVDGQPVPHNPLELDFSKDQYVRVYQTLFVGTDRKGQDRGIFIPIKEYKDSNTLFRFNLSPDFCSSGEHLSLIKHSNLRLELKFSKSLEQTVCFCRV